MIIFVAPAQKSNLTMLKPLQSNSDSAFGSKGDIDSSFNQHASDNFQSIKMQILSDSKKNRRGRPKSDEIPDLILNGHNSDSAIKCHICNRVFPRPKSLQAHARTHTGEKPFACDFPSCPRAFAQSGQLKTHQLLHTGEKPFMCPIADCQVRHTHGNRRCQIHPDMRLVRDEDKEINLENMENVDTQVMEWYKRHSAKRAEKKPSKGQKRKQTESKDMMPEKRPLLQNVFDESGYISNLPSDSESSCKSEIVPDSENSCRSEDAEHSKNFVIDTEVSPTNIGSTNRHEEVMQWVAYLLQFQQERPTQ